MIFSFFACIQMKNKKTMKNFDAPNFLKLQPKKRKKIDKRNGKT